MEARLPAARDADLVPIYRDQIGRIVATLIRVLGDFDLAEEIAQEAFVAALEQWPSEGVPENPAAWLVRTAKHKAIDEARRRGNLRRKIEQAELVSAIEQSFAPEPEDESRVEDDRLRLMFICCHPSLALDAQVALTLRTVGGLTTEEIARAFLVPVPTMAQRLVRAKGKIKGAGIPYRVPPAEVLGERAGAVLTVLYLIFTEGYAATEGDALIRRELCAESIRLGRLVAALLPDLPEATALVALMLLTDARKTARVDDDGDLVLLEDQDRAKWDRAEIDEGLELVLDALRASRGAPGPYALQAAIAGCHARATKAEETDWPQIEALYALLYSIHPSPIVALNGAVASAMVRGPESGLAIIARIAKGELDDYYLLHAASADLLRRLGRFAEAEAAYARALELAQSEPERRFLKRRLTETATAWKKA
jgi:RNA polymerase sigma-70 factor (ECF subfamily)